MNVSHEFIITYFERSDWTQIFIINKTMEIRLHLDFIET